MSGFDIGDRRKLTCEIRDESRVLADPESLVFYMLTPDGETVTYRRGTDAQLVRDSEGLFHVYWDCGQSGFHGYRFESQNPTVAEEDSFVVAESILGEIPA